jgi:membrane protease YdiL (CAAX protease family)
MPMWVTGEGLTWVWAPALLVVMMFMPALATFVVNRWISPRPDLLRQTGVTNPGGSKKWWPFALIAWFGPPAATVLALLVGWAFGVYDADWAGFSGLSEQLQSGFAPDARTPPARLALAQVAEVLLLGWLNIIPAFGEEWGWRGYLTLALLPLGQPGAFLVTGVLWGMWHAPLLVLGYNYPNVPVVVAFIMMLCFCTLTGVLLSWLRLASDSVWPAAVAHGFLNAAAGLSVVFSDAGHAVNNVTAGLLGWPGWLVLVLLITLLVWLGKLPVEIVREQPGLTRGVIRRSRR